MKVLVIEDTEKLARLIVESLRLHGYVTEHMPNAVSALHAIASEKYDVIILDRMLPGGVDGLNICEQLRAGGNHTPILVLTALGSVERKLEGFAHGSDDYLAKPFDMRELLARVDTLARRHDNAFTQTIVRCGQVHINLSKQIVTVRGSEIRLSKRLWALLAYLALHQGQTMSKETLIDRVWGIDKDVLENAVEVAIRNVRHKIGDEKGNIIQTVHGFGYRLAA